ncbi:MAG: hypothetical protein M3P52_06715 [Actinomycetota bacterium]|nr:hypothetical protein [Actinomycetota bacterium]
MKGHRYVDSVSGSRPPDPQPRRRRGSGRGFVIAGLAFAHVALAVCVAVFYFFRPVAHEVRDFDDPGPNQVVVYTCEISGRRATLTATIRNLDLQAHDYRVEIEFDDGVAASTVTVSVPHLAAGATAPVSAATTNLVGTAVTCRVANVFGSLPFDVES